MNLNSVSHPQVSKVSVSFNLAHKLGAEDASDGNPFNPSIFTNSEDAADYAAGYESVKGVSEATRQFIGSTLPKPIIVPNYKTNDRERIRRIDMDANAIFRASEQRAKRIARAMAETAAFLGVDDGEILFA